METTGRLDRGDGTELAWSRLDGPAPTVVFLPGFRSDMTGDKATALAAFCAARGQAMLRFDYSATASAAVSSSTATIGLWAADALTVLDQSDRRERSFWSDRRWAAGSRCSRLCGGRSGSPPSSASPPRPTSPKN